LGNNGNNGNNGNKKKVEESEIRSPEVKGGMKK